LRGKEGDYSVACSEGVCALLVQWWENGGLTEETHESSVN